MTATTTASSLSSRGGASWEEAGALSPTVSRATASKVTDDLRIAGRFLARGAITFVRLHRGVTCSGVNAEGGTGPALRSRGCYPQFAAVTGFALAAARGS